MTLLRRSAPLETRATFESPTVPLTSTSLLDWLTGPRVHAGVTVNEKTAMGMPAVYRAVNLLSGALAGSPLKAFRDDADGNKVPAGPRSTATQLLAKPHPDLTPYELWELAVAHVALWGNSYHRILRDSLDAPKELWPIEPWTIRAGRAKGGQKFYEIDGDRDADGGPKPYTDREILHIPGIGYDGVCGVSPIRVARQGIGLALAAEEYGARLWGSGSLASGILQTEQRLTQEQADTLKERWKAKSSGLANAHEAVVLDRGATFQPLSIHPDDAQFIESRRFQIAEVARLYGIPPHMLMDMERSTSWGTGIEQQAIGFVVWTLRPWVIRFEQRITKLFNPDTVYARFNLGGLLRGDAAGRAAFYKAMWEIGAFNTDEIRALEELPPVPGGAGKQHYRPLNFGALGEYASENANQPNEGITA